MRFFHPIYLFDFLLSKIILCDHMRWKLIKIWLCLIFNWLFGENRSWHYNDLTFTINSYIYILKPIVKLYHVTTSILRWLAWINRIMWPHLKWELQTLKFDSSISCFQIYNSKVWTIQKYLFQNYVFHEYVYCYKNQLKGVFRK